MVNQSILLLIMIGSIMTIPFASAQEFEKATLQESAILLYDQKFSNSVIVSIGLESTDNNEIRFTDELIEKINENEKIRSIVFTNAGNCVIGVTSEQQCIMINFDYQQLKGDGGIRMVQESAKEMSLLLIEDLEEIFGMESEFHSTFIHTVDDANMLLETSGAVSGRGSVSATYVMPKQSTDFLFLDMAGGLISKDIREAGGFFDISKELAKNDDSIISVSIIRNQESNLFMFKVAHEIKNATEDISKISILEEFGIDKISRSDVFDGKNVPLNSIIQLLVIPNESVKIDAISTHAIMDVTKIENISEKGWFLSSPAGEKIDMRFLFGIDKQIESDELRVELGPWDGETEMSFYSVEQIQKETEYESIDSFMKEDDASDADQTQYAVLGIIIAVGIGAAVFYLKGYKPKR